MNKIIVDIFMYFFEAILLFYYASALFKSDVKKPIQIISIFFASSILCIVYQFGYFYINAALLILLYTLILNLIYKAPIKTAIIHSAIFVFVMFASEIIFLTLNAIINNREFDIRNNELPQYITAVITSKIIYFSIIIAIRYYFMKKKYELSNNVNKYFWLLFFMPISSILMLLSYRYIASYVILPEKINFLWISSSITVLFVNILIFIIYERTQRDTNELYALRNIQSRQEQDKKYFEIIDKSNKEMRIFAHDTKNHLLQMRSSNSIEDVHNYIDKLMPNIEKFEQIGISKNKMLDLIISKYMTLCELKNIELDIDVKTANLSYIDDVDLSTLMNNLLDNAVEAAEKSSGGFIKIKIFSKNKMYDALIIQNSSSEKPVIENNILLTSKRDKRVHGIGISSIKRVLKKYDAVYDWSYFEDLKVFQTNIAFPKR